MVCSITPRASLFYILPDGQHVVGFVLLYSRRRCGFPLQPRGLLRDRAGTASGWGVLRDGALLKRACLHGRNKVLVVGPLGKGARQLMREDAVDARLLRPLGLSNAI